MKTVTVNTYAGSTIQVDRRAFQKAAKMCTIRGSSPFQGGSSTDAVVRYLRAKQSAFLHAVDKAGLYCMKIEGRKIFVI